MSNQRIQAIQGDIYRCQQCGMELLITKDSRRDHPTTELKCYGQPLDRVTPQVQNA